MEAQKRARRSLFRQFMPSYSYRSLFILIGLYVQVLLFGHQCQNLNTNELTQEVAWTHRQHQWLDVEAYPPSYRGDIGIEHRDLFAGIDYSLPFPVFFVNMDRSASRRERMELDFGRVWDLRRSPAVDGSNATQVLELMGQDNVDRIAPYVKEDRGPDTINRAELGCILSHLATIRRAYVEGHALAMIVEDDITPLLMPFWVASIQDLVDEADALNAFENQPWDLIQLAWIWGLNEDLYDNIKDRHGPGRQLVRVRFQFGTSAYLISRAGMEKVLDAHFSDRSPQGLIRLQEGGRQAELYVAAAPNVLVTVPSLFTIDGSDTTISTGEEEQRRLRSHRESNWVHVRAMLDVHRAADKSRQAAGNAQPAEKVG